MFFNVFVLLQIFNEVNARKLKSTELNIFKNFFNNPLFLVIMILTLIIQIACIEFGGQSLKTVPLTQRVVYFYDLAAYKYKNKLIKNEQVRLVKTL